MLISNDAQEIYLVVFCLLFLSLFFSLDDSFLAQLPTTDLTSSEAFYVRESAESYFHTRDLDLRNTR